MPVKCKHFVHSCFGLKYVKGKELAQLISFVGRTNISYKTKELFWEEDNPPEDLIIFIKGTKLEDGDYVIIPVEDEELDEGFRNITIIPRDKVNSDSLRFSIYE